MLHTCNGCCIHRNAPPILGGMQLQVGNATPPGVGILLILPLDSSALSVTVIQLYMQNKQFSDMKTFLSKQTPLLANLLLVVSLLVPQFVLAQSATQPTLGDGSKDKPYQIESLENLMWFRNQVNNGNVSLCAILTQDIDMKGQNWKPIATSYNAYKGIFDGQGHTLSNLNINNSNDDYNGLFGRISGATIQNIVFENPSVALSKKHVGIAVGYCFGGSVVKDITINSGTITNKSFFGSSSGGVVGTCKQSSIRSCSNAAKVYGYDRQGGIAGSCENTVIEDCINHGIISGGSILGGIVGEVSGTTLKNVLNMGNITTIKGAKYGFIIGTTGSSTSTNSTADGFLAYSSSATIAINDVVQTGDEVKAVGIADNLYAPDGSKNFDGIITSFTPEQLRSGEAAWLLNGKTSTPAEGEQLGWYQKLGDDGGDASPSVRSRGGDIVWHGLTCVGSKDCYTNDPRAISADGKAHDYQCKDKETEGLYGWYCTRCGRSRDDERYVALDGRAYPGITLRPNGDGTYTAQTAIVFSDAEAYRVPVVFRTSWVTYQRRFKDNNWQALYVPFAVPTAELSEDYEVAVPNNFHEYLTDDGRYGVELEVMRVTDGSTIPALTPCLIRRKTALDGEKWLTWDISDVRMEAAKSNSITCWSVSRYYQFTGTFEGNEDGKDVFDPNKDFVMKNGALYKAAKNARLSPQRWYLTATDRSSGQPASAAPLARIAIKVVGDGSATAISDLHVTSEDAVAPGKQGIYDLQGRRLSQEPAHGIYIKNGKKYVK